MTATFDIDRPQHATATLLTPSEARRLRALLVDERDALRSQLAEYARVLAQFGEERGDIDGAERELVGLHAARAGEMVEEIDQALSRLDDGSYGACASCGRPIPFERLEAIPRARFCVACPPPSVRRR
ncbi:MAG: TraR/DksA C4-type zinc finger protein [Actinomycetota bacterium]|nr:TraR/DksA C4-type zinc finger protein [Actinomycetota bacterium]